MGDANGPLPTRRALVEVNGSAAAEIAIRVVHDEELKSLRVLRFEKTDAAPERWRAAGLVVASLVLLSRRESPPAPPSTPEPAPRSPDAPPSAELALRQPHRQLWGAWLAASAGSWAPNVPWLFGGELGLELFPVTPPIGLYIRVEASQALALIESSVRMSRQALALGVVSAFPVRSRFRLVLRGQLKRERLAATARNDTGQSDAGETWRTAGVLALAPTLTIDGRLSANVGVQVALYDGAPNVRVAETIVAQASRVTASGFVGIRVGF